VFAHKTRCWRCGCQCYQKLQEPTKLEVNQVVSLGILLFVLGIIVVAVAYIAHTPAPLATIGWLCIGVGLVLTVLGYVLPALNTPDYAALLH
jgi:hypothetical protein